MTARVVAIVLCIQRLHNTSLEDATSPNVCPDKFRANFFCPGLSWFVRGVVNLCPDVLVARNIHPQDDKCTQLLLGTLPQGP